MPKWQTQHLIRCQATLEPSGAAIGFAGSTASRVVVPTKGLISLKHVEKKKAEGDLKGGRVPDFLARV